MFAEKACFNVLCTCKATLLSKMARLVWRYSDDAGAIIENVYKICMEEKKSGMKLSLNRIWDRTAALTGVTITYKYISIATNVLPSIDLPFRKLWKRSRRHRTSSNSQSNHRHLRRKCHWMTFTRVLYGGPSPACTP